MKKIIGILVVLFVTTGVYGQISFNVTEFFPQLFFKYSLRSEFTDNGKQYAIAYDSVWIDECNPIQKKDVHLWRKDGNNWTIVSTRPLRTDYVKHENNIGIYHCWVDNPRSSIKRKCDLNELLGNDVGYSSVESRCGSLFIKMLSFSGVLGEDKYEKHHDLIVLNPNEDGTFTPYKPNIQMISTYAKSSTLL